jgi:hypothetical protein
LQTPRTAATNLPKALPNAAKFTAAGVLIAGADRQLNDHLNYMILQHYFMRPVHVEDQMGVEDDTRLDEV